MGAQCAPILTKIMKHIDLYVKCHAEKTGVGKRYYTLIDHRYSREYLGSVGIIGTPMGRSSVSFAASVHDLIMRVKEESHIRITATISSIKE